MKKIILFVLVLAVVAGCSRSKQVTVKSVELLEVKAMPDTVSNAMNRFLEPYRTIENKEMDVVLGSCDTTMDVTLPEGLLNNLIGKMMLECAKSQMPTDFALSNTGGVRNILHKGEITKGDVWDILPFDNMLVVLTLDGKQTKELCDVIARKGGAVTAGLSMGIKNGKADHVLIGGVPLDTLRSYNIATNDYLSFGNDYFLPLAHYTKIQNLHIVLRDMMVDYIKQQTAEGKIITSSINHDIYVEK